MLSGSGISCCSLPGSRLLWSAQAHPGPYTLHPCLYARRRPIKNQAAWKPVLARLRLIELLLPRLGVAQGGGPDSGGGFAPEPLMGFLSAALGNANAEVGPHPKISTLNRSAGSACT